MSARDVPPVVDDAGHLPARVDGDHVLLNYARFVVGQVRVELKSEASARDDVGRQADGGRDAIQARAVVIQKIIRIAAKAT